MNLKLDVVKLANEDVIATSVVDHKTLRHAKIWNNPSYSVNVEGTNYEYGDFYLYDAPYSKWNTCDWFDSYENQLDLTDDPNDTGKWYKEIAAGVWVPCNEEHPED